MQYEALELRRRQLVRQLRREINAGFPPPGRESGIRQSIDDPHFVGIDVGAGDRISEPAERQRAHEIERADHAPQPEPCASTIGCCVDQSEAQGEVKPRVHGTQNDVERDQTEISQVVSAVEKIRFTPESVVADHGNRRQERKCADEHEQNTPPG